MEEIGENYPVAAVEKEHEFDIRLSVHDGGPSLEVVFVSGKAVDEEAELLIVYLYGLLHSLSTRVRKSINASLEPYPYTGETPDRLTENMMGLVTSIA